MQGLQTCLVALLSRYNGFCLNQALCSRTSSRNLIFPLRITYIDSILEPFRWFKPAAESFVKVPFIGAVSHLTLAVCPFCIAFAVVWAVFRQLPYAWIGQDILVSVALFSMIFVEMNL